MHFLLCFGFCVFNQPEIRISWSTSSLQFWARCCHWNNPHYVLMPPLTLLYRRIQYDTRILHFYYNIIKVSSQKNKLRLANNKGKRYFCLIYDIMFLERQAGIFRDIPKRWFWPIKYMCSQFSRQKDEISKPCKLKSDKLWHSYRLPNFLASKEESWCVVTHFAFYLPQI